MKYNIEGIELGETIASHSKAEKDVLEVKYRDNTKDYFPAKKEIVEKVNTIMEEQATTYVNSGREGSLAKKKIGYTVGSLISGGCLLATTPYIASGIISSQPEIIATGAAAVCVGSLAVSLVKRGSAKKELDYIKKLRLFLENKGLISERYTTIREAEQNLGMGEGFKTITINNVDRLSLDAMEEAISKCKRYPIVDETPFQKHL